MVNVTPRPPLTRGKTRYPLYRRLAGPQGRSRRVRKISPPTGIRSADLPARSESLYRLRYPGPPYRRKGMLIQWVSFIVVLSSTAVMGVAANTGFVCDKAGVLVMVVVETAVLMAWRMPCTSPDRLWGQPSLLCSWYRVFFPAVRQSGHGVYSPPPHLSPWLKKL